MKTNAYRFVLILALTLLSKTSFATDPIKAIKKTQYCSNMDLIDQASHVSLAQVSTADYIVVSKSRRLLYLLNQGQIIKTYSVAFGNGAKDGPKIKRGDGRTPEGLYFVDVKNPNSNYHLGLHLSYPSSDDFNFAKVNKLDPGSDIMIHGFPKGFIDNLNPDVVRKTHPSVDWTQGCIAVSDTEIDEIFAAVKVKTPVEICPLETKK